MIRTQEQIDAFSATIERETSDFTQWQRQQYDTLVNAALNKMGTLDEFESRCRQAIKDIKAV